MGFNTGTWDNMGFNTGTLGSKGYASGVPCNSCRALCRCCFARGGEREADPPSRLDSHGGTEIMKERPPKGGGAVSTGGMGGASIVTLLFAA